MNRNTPLNLFWETVQCPNSLLTPYSCGRVHTGEVPPPLPAAAGEATTSHRSQTIQLQQLRQRSYVLLPAPRLVALHLAALSFMKGLPCQEARP